MKNLFNSFYSVVLLALCLIAFSNCSDSDDGGEVGGTDNGITAISSEMEKTVSLYGETVEIRRVLFRSRLLLLENGLLLYNTLQDRTGRLLLIPVVILLPVKEDLG